MAAVVETGISETKRPGSQAQLWKGLYYEHWFADIQAQLNARDVAINSELIRVWDRQGALVGRMGRVDHYEGELLTHYLNRGTIAAYADTIWFIRKADARVLAFPANEFRATPARIIDLPVYYRADQPVEFVHSDGRAAARVAEHVWASTIGPDGNFYIVQSVGWPAIEAKGVPFLPRTALAIVDRSGLTRGVYDLPSVAAWIAATTEWIFVTQGAGDRIVVAAIRNPVFNPEDGSDCVGTRVARAAAGSPN